MLWTAELSELSFAANEIGTIGTIVWSDFFDRSSSTDKSLQGA